MCVFNKERFQETLWLEGVGIIPEEAIQERLQLLHRQGLDKSYSQDLPKKKLPDLRATNDRTQNQLSNDAISTR